MSKPTDIELSVGLSAKDTKQSAEALRKNIEDIFGKSAGGALDSKLQKIQQQMSQTAAKAQTVVDKMKQLEGTKVPTDRYKNLTSIMEELEGKLEKLGNESANLQKGPQTSKVATRLQEIENEADKLQTKFVNVEEQLRDLEDAGKAFTLGSGTAEYDQLSNNLANLNNQQRVNIERWNEATNAEKKATTATENLNKSVKKVSSSMKETSKHTANFGNNMKKVTLSFIKAMIGVRGLYMLFRKLREAIVDGVKNVVLWEGASGALNKSLSSISSSFATLKNNIGAAVAPLLNALAPAITKIIDLISIAVNKMAQFIALFSGKSTYLVADKVQKNFAAGLDKTAGSAKKAEKALKGYLSPLDEINKYQSDKDTDTGGGSGGGGVDTGSFKEVPVDPKLLKWLEDLKKKIASLKKYWDAFKKGFLQGLGDWETPFNMIKDGIQRIGKALVDIWTDPKVSKARERYFLSLAEMLGTAAGTALRAGLDIGANIAQGIANALEDRTEAIKKFLINMFDIGTDINKQLTQLFLAIGQMFDTLISTEGIHMTTEFVKIFIDAFMLITTQAARFVQGFVTILVQPIVRNIDKITQTLKNLWRQLGDLFAVVDEIIVDISKMADNLWNNHLKPMIDNVTDGLSELVGTVLDGWNTYIVPAIDNIIATVKELWEVHIQPYANDIIEIIGYIAETVGWFFKVALVPYIQSFVNHWLPMVRDAINFIVSVIKTAVGLASTPLQAMFSLIKTVLQFVKDVFTVGWKQAWENAKTNFVSIWETMKAKMKSIINGMIDIINSFLSYAVSKINAFVGKFTGPAAAVAGALGQQSVASALSNFKLIGSAPQIPHLAQGAVIPPNKEFMAVLGDQNRGTNIETPLDTMIQAFKSAIQDMGGTGVQTINFLLPDKKMVAQYAIEGGQILQVSKGRNPFDLL